MALARRAPELQFPDMPDVAPAQEPAHTTPEAWVREHLGHWFAYWRSNGGVPPWSK